MILYKKIILSLCLLGTFAIAAQDKKRSWAELTKEYQFPRWYTEARFGIWAHWGAQTHPDTGGGWYARHMYQEDVGDQKWGLKAYQYHVKTFGHPSKIGYKDVLNDWKAENLDADALMKYFKSLGAKFFMILANHHDRFDNFDSTHFQWNSVNVGPKKDIVGLFEKAARKYDLPFGVSSHDDRFLNWWKPAFGADKTGPYKGVPYDGYMTKEDGIGKWWEGLDPAELYGLPPEKRTPEWIKKVKEQWVKKTEELMTKYDVDLIWFDGYGFPYGDYGKEACTYFLNYKIRKYGKPKGVIVGKINGESATVKDIERGGAHEILLRPWQGITTIRSWFYKAKPTFPKNRQSARTIIEILSDYISKNGNLVLNVELRSDGTIPPEQKPILDDIGMWVNLNGEAIYASKPWKVYGDNLDSYLKKAGTEKISEADLEALKKQKKATHFNERTVNSPAYGNDEVRYTTNDGFLYVFVLNPKKGVIELPTLGRKSKTLAKKIKSIRLIGSEKKIRFRQKKDELVLKVPKKRPNQYTAVFKVGF